MVFVPSVAKLEELSKSSDNGEEAFEQDEVLRHLTLFSHVFRVNEEEFNELNDGDSLLSLNGMVASVVQSGNNVCAWFFMTKGCLDHHHPCCIQTSLELDILIASNAFGKQTVNASGYFPALI